MWSDCNVLDIDQYRIYFFQALFNPFAPNAPFLYSLKTSENRKVFWCFQGIEKWCIGNKYVNLRFPEIPLFVHLLKTHDYCYMDGIRFQLRFSFVRHPRWFHDNSSYYHNISAMAVWSTLRSLLSPFIPITDIFLGALTLCKLRPFPPLLRPLLNMLISSPNTSPVLNAEIRSSNSPGDRSDIERLLSSADKLMFISFLEACRCRSRSFCWNGKNPFIKSCCHFTILQEE